MKVCVRAKSVVECNAGAARSFVDAGLWRGSRQLRLGGSEGAGR